MSTHHLIPEHQLMDAEKVLINPLNNSRSKQQYSFPKAQRWQRCKTETQNYHFYLLPTTKSQISTSMGTSQRQPLQKRNQAPAPNHYNYTLDGQFNKRSSKGHCFGLGRNDIKTGSFLRMNTEIPPPNAYNIPTLPRREFSFTRDQKFRNKSQRESLNNLGPGAYHVQMSLDQTKQRLSNQPRHCSPKIFQPRSHSRKETHPTSPPLCTYFTSRPPPDNSQRR